MELYLAPVKFYSNVLLQNFIAELSRRFTAKVNTVNLNINLDDFFSVDRKQYYSTQIIAEAIKMTELLNGKVLIVTDVDIFVPALTFVFGEAQLNGKHSILSVCRLHEEFYSEVSNEKLLLDRTLKEALHELGHNFGLRHCVNWDCVMHSSHGIEEVDIKGDKYCTECAKAVEIYKTFY